MTEPTADSRLNPTASNTLNRVRRIPLQRWLALALITLEAVTIAYLSKTTVYPAVIICVAVFGILSRVRFEFDRQRTYDIIALMAVVFVSKYMVTPDNPRYADLFPSPQMAFALAQYVLAMQCVQFFLKRRDDRMPFSFPGIGVIALVCAAMVSLNPSEQPEARPRIQALCVGFAILAVLYCDASRRFVRIVPARRFGRPIATVLVLVAVGNLGWFTASSMFRYERHVEAFVNRFMEQHHDDSSIGFSESSTLGSISLKKDVDSQRTALRVVAAVEPGYFRARAYDVYENQKWLLNAEGRALNPERSAPAGLQSDTHNGNVFHISHSASQATQRFEVWPDADLRDTFASPLRTSWLYADARIVTVDTHNVMRSSDAISGVPYTLIVRDSNQPPTDGIDQDVASENRLSRTSSLNLEQLRTPPEWALSNKRLVQLAESLFKDCESVRDKVEAAQRHFHQNYSYSLNVTTPADPNHEPLGWFLQERPAAHCEYFASGAAVLLRMAGVPCRYVVGFVISEQNRYSGEWVARNEDAHAWVEAYDESFGWITVDATPSAGIPDDAEVSTGTQLYEYMRDEFHRMRIGWQQKGFASLRASIQAIILSPIGIGLIAAAMLTGTGILLWRSWRHSRSGRRIYSAPASAIVPLQTAREKLDRTLNRVWRVRLPGETITLYAQQLASGAHDQHDPLLQTATWYEQYASLRFVREPDDSKIAEVVGQADKLAADLRRRRRVPDNGESRSG